MAALIPALIKLLMSRRGGGGGGYSRGGYSKGGYGGGGQGKRDSSMYYTNIAALKEGQDLPDWDKSAAASRRLAAEAYNDAVRGLINDTKIPGVE